MITSLIFRGCNSMSAFPLDELLTPHLRVLDLSYTPINSLPSSFSHLQNLYMLSLRGCSQLETLSPQPSSEKQTSPLAHLENLRVLDKNGVRLLELTQEDGSNKSNLHYLDYQAQSSPPCLLNSSVKCQASRSSFLESAPISERCLVPWLNCQICWFFMSRGLRLPLFQSTCSKKCKACIHSS
jgi:hypothetical protein